MTLFDQFSPEQQERIARETEREERQLARDAEARAAETTVPEWQRHSMWEKFAEVAQAQDREDRREAAQAARHRQEPVEGTSIGGSPWDGESLHTVSEKLAQIAAASEVEDRREAALAARRRRESGSGLSDVGPVGAATDPASSLAATKAPDSMVKHLAKSVAGLLGREWDRTH